MKDKPLLTAEEIEEILLDAEDCARHLEFENIYFQPSTWKSVISLSTINKIIFIKGNEEIGFTHIRKRHSDYHLNTSFKEKAFRQSGKIDTPSHFRQDAITLDDFKVISDQLYCYGEKGNKDYCDSYTGLWKHNDGTEIEYRLVLIENTKIVISLYPTKPVGNIKKPEGFLWHRAKVKSFDYVENDKRIIQIAVLYYNKKLELEYEILVKYFMEEKLEQVFIVVLNENGFPEANIVGKKQNPVISQRNFTELPQLDILESMYQHGSLFDYEKIILDFHKRQNKK